MAVENLRQTKACSICKDTSHPTDGCPVLHDEGLEQVSMAGNVSEARRQYDPYSNTYNRGWRDHPNFSHRGNKQQNSFSNRQQGFQLQYALKPQPHSSNADMSLEDMVKTLVSNTMQLQQNAIQYQQKMDTSIRNIENQLSQIASTLYCLES